VAESKSRLVRYRVRKGDTLGGIADQFSVSPEELRKWNGLKTARVSRGMVLRVYTIGGAPETVSVRKRSTAKKKTGSGVNTASAATHSKKTP
jgi:membrane-bound lytic murein transglycosylase D